MSTAIIHDPEIIFRDEPTSGVDPAEYCGCISVVKNGRVEVIDNPHRLKELYCATSMQEIFLKVVSGAHA